MLLIISHDRTCKRRDSSQPRCRTTAQDIYGCSFIFKLLPQNKTLSFPQDVYTWNIIAPALQEADAITFQLSSTTAVLSIFLVQGVTYLELSSWYALTSFLFYFQVEGRCRRISYDSFSPVIVRSDRHQLNIAACLVHSRCHGVGEIHSNGENIPSILSQFSSMCMSMVTKALSDFSQLQHLSDPRLNSTRNRPGVSLTLCQSCCPSPSPRHCRHAVVCVLVGFLDDNEYFFLSVIKEHISKKSVHGCEGVSTSCSPLLVLPKMNLCVIDQCICVGEKKQTSVSE